MDTNGHQWTLAIGAAGQISACRAGLLERGDVTLARTRDDVCAKARKLKAGGKNWVEHPFFLNFLFMS